MSNRNVKKMPMKSLLAVGLLCGAMCLTGCGNNNNTDNRPQMNTENVNRPSETLRDTETNLRDEVNNNNDTNHNGVGDDVNNNDTNHNGVGDDIDNMGNDLERMGEGAVDGVRDAGDTVVDGVRGVGNGVRDALDGNNR